jgi:O-antigen/teichoic acid export membrane protein
MSSAADVNFIRESIITFLADSLDKIAAFIAFVYFANYFSTTAFGAAYTVIGMSMVAGSVPKAIGVAVSKRVSEDTTSHDRYFLLGVVSILGVAGVAAVIVAVATRLFAAPFEGLALAGIVHLTARPLLYHVERVFDGVGETGAAASLDFVDGVLTALLRFVLILGVGLGAEGLLYSGALSAVAVGAVAYGRRFGLPTEPPSLDAVHDIQGFARWALVSRIGNEVFQNAPVVLAGVLLSPTLASWIKSAQTLMMPSFLPVRSVTKSVFVQVSGDTTRGSINLDPIQNGIDVASLLALPLLGGAFVLGDALMMTVFGAGYGGAGVVLVAIAAGTVFHTQNRILTSTLNGSDNPQLAALTHGIHAVVYPIAFAVALVSESRTLFLGLIVLGFATHALLAYGLVTRSLLDSGTDALSLRFAAEQAVATGIMTIVVAAIWPAVTVGSWVHLVAPIGLGGMVYVIALVGMSSRSRTILRSILARFPA